MCLFNEVYLHKFLYIILLVNVLTNLERFQGYSFCNIFSVKRLKKPLEFWSLCANIFFEGSVELFNEKNSILASFLRNCCKSFTFL